MRVMSEREQTKRVKKRESKEDLREKQDQEEEKGKSEFAGEAIEFGESRKKKIFDSSETGKTSFKTGFSKQRQLLDTRDKRYLPP